MFDAKTVQGAIDALANGDGTAALEILKALLTAAATGGGYAPPAGADPMTEAADPPADQKEYAAFARGLMTLSQTDTVGAAHEWVKRLAADRAKVDADRAELEASERRSLVTELVTLRAETPATAWEKNDKGEIPEGDARKPCKRLAAEPIAELRTRVAALRPAQPASNNGNPRPPAANGDPDLRRLSDYERETASKIKDPEKRKDYVERRLSRLDPVTA